MKLVSIIVPMFNKEKYIAECIESIIKQTYKNIEIIIIDDGSEDDSLSICKFYEKNDKRIKVYSQVNKGVSHARNRGLSLAQGYYLSFIDADDYIAKDFISQLVHTINVQNTDVVYCNYLQDYNGEYLKKKPRIAPGRYKIKDLASIMIDDGTITGILFSSVCIALYKKDSIKNNDISFETDLTHNEDGLFNLEVLFTSRELFFLGDEYLYINRRVNNSATKGIIDDRRFEDATDKIIELCNRKDTDYANYIQFKRRNVSIAFWKIVSYSNSKKIDKKNAINEIYYILNDTELETSYEYLDIKNMNKPKLVLSFLMKKKQARLLYFLIKKLYPLLSSVYKR